MKLIKELSSLRPYIIAIESSCDDTCLAILNRHNSVIHEYKISQKRLHQPFGGIVPNLAAQGHKTSFGKILDTDLLKSILKYNQVQFIAVTKGPGLGSCLNAGFEFAKQLSIFNGLPLLHVNHLLGHLLSADIKESYDFPRLSLIVSGGNTQLILSTSIMSHHILGITLDDALGEALDKSARLLSCSWSDTGGLGRELERLASSGKHLFFKINVLKNYKDPLSFSFSGLKTALKLFIKQETYADATVEDLAATIQNTLFDHIVTRVKNCFLLLKKLDYKIKEFFLIGGVASNLALRSSLENEVKKYGIRLIAPELNLCQDNAVMIGVAANRMVSYGGTQFFQETGRINTAWNLEELLINKAVLE